MSGKVHLLSYHPGLSGDFVAYCVHKDPAYHQVGNNLKRDDNRYMFPDLTSELLNIDAKMMLPDKAIPFTEEHFKLLQKQYNGKHIVLPTHWYCNHEIKLFDKRIRLYTDNEEILRMSYVHWWLKSHMACIEVWPSRIEQINEIQDSAIRNDLLENFHNWKYLAYKFNIQQDLQTYIIEFYTTVYRPLASRTYEQQFTYIDINDLYNGKLDMFNNEFEVNIDSKLVSDYTNSNIQLINEKGINVNTNKFLTQLYKYVSTNISQPMKPI